MALGRGELDTMSCAEKFDCLESARRSKENASRLALALIKQLGFDQFQQIFDWVGSNAFYSLHIHCLKKGLATMPGPGRAEMIQKISNLPRFDMYLTKVCSGNTMRISEISKAFKDAANIVLAEKKVARVAELEEDERKENGRKMNEAKLEEEKGACDASGGRVGGRRMLPETEQA